MNKNQSFGIWIIIGLLVLCLVSMLLSNNTNATENISYTKFIEKIKNSEIKKNSEP